MSKGSGRRKEDVKQVEKNLQNVEVWEIKTFKDLGEAQT